MNISRSDEKHGEPATLLAGPGPSFSQPHSRMEIIRKGAEKCVEKLALVRQCTALQGRQAYGHSRHRGIHELRSGLLPDACNCAGAIHMPKTTHG